MTTVSLPNLRIIPYKAYSASFNMAADEYLLSIDQPILRFYGWETRTLSFGRSNFHPRGINAEVFKDSSVEKVKRLSGGKTVLHEHELTYTFSCNSDLFPPSILETYRLISQPLADAFLTLGLNPQMEKTGKVKSESTICFKEVSSYELTINKKKVVGSAQYRRRKQFLQHGSIVIDIDWEYWHHIWNLPKTSNMLKDRITSIYEESGIKISPAELADNITDKFQKSFNVQSSILDFSEQELQGISGLQDKYEWQGFVK